MPNAPRLLGLVLLVFCAVSSPATAGFIGKTVGIFDRASSGFPPTTTDSLLRNTVVGTQVEYDANFDFIDIEDTKITFGNNDRNCFGGFCPIQRLGLGDFFGFKIADIADELDDIVGVSVLSSTDFPTFMDADISFSADEIFIHIESVGMYSPANVIPYFQVELEVTFAEAAVQISAPGAGFLLAAGVFAIARSRRRKRT